MVFFGLKEILCENIFLQKAVNCCIFTCHEVIVIPNVGKKIRIIN